MKKALDHPWDVTAAQAKEIQERLRSQVVTQDELDEIRTVAGIDVGLDKATGHVRSAVAVLSFPGLELVDQAVHTAAAQFPYVPGLLSFREIPAVLAALERLRTQPDLVLCDGQGFAHPRRFGLACHLGLVTDLPCIGVAKKRLIGAHGDVPDQRGLWTPLKHRREVIGAVLRTRPGVKPVFVSLGHRISLPTAVFYTMACTTRFRLPETTRWAHRLASGAQI